MRVQGTLQMALHLAVHLHAYLVVQHVVKLDTRLLLLVVHSQGNTVRVHAADGDQAGDSCRADGDQAGDSCRAAWRPEDGRDPALRRGTAEGPVEVPSAVR